MCDSESITRPEGAIPRYWEPRIAAPDYALWPVQVTTSAPAVARPSRRAFPTMRVAVLTLTELVSDELERSEIRGGRDLVEDDVA